MHNRQIAFASPIRSHCKSYFGKRKIYLKLSLHCKSDLKPSGENISIESKLLDLHVRRIFCTLHFCSLFYTHLLRYTVKKSKSEIIDFDFSLKFSKCYISFLDIFTLPVPRLIFAHLLACYTFKKWKR